MPLRRLSSRATLLLAAALAALLLAACGDDGTQSSTGAEATSTTAATSQATTAETGSSTGAEGSAAEAGTVVPAPDADPGEVELYFTSGEQFEAVRRPKPTGGDEIEAVTEELVEGPTEAEASRKVEVQTAIPEGTEVHSIRLSDDGTAEVELTSAFLRGVPADPAARDEDEQAELDARVGQVAHTLDQFDRVKRTRVVAGGVEAPATEPDEYAKPASGPKDADAGADKRRSGRGKGSGSAGVRRIQDRLAALRYLPRSAVDGVNGYRTQQAVIAFQAWEKLDRDGVVGPITKAALADASPPRPKLDGPSKRVEVYRDKGVALLVKDDRTKRAIHVSTGAAGTETPRGRFEVFRKELNSWSVPFQTWLPFASYFFQGIAFHEYPDVPPYPASHGCVRVPAPEAEVVYDFAGIGTAVAVR